MWYCTGRYTPAYRYSTGSLAEPAYRRDPPQKAAGSTWVTGVQEAADFASVYAKEKRDLKVERLIPGGNKQFKEIRCPRIAQRIPYDLLAKAYQPTKGDNKQGQKHGNTNLCADVVPFHRTVVPSTYEPGPARTWYWSPLPMYWDQTRSDIR